MNDQIKQSHEHWDSIAVVTIMKKGNRQVITSEGVGFCSDVADKTAEIVAYVMNHPKEVKSQFESFRRMKRIVVATEQEDQAEALYVDGTLITCEQTIYASEIAQAADGQPVLIVNRQVELGDGESFPRDESDLRDCLP